MRALRDVASVTREILQRRSHRASTAVTVALVLSVTLNVLLAHKVRSLTHLETPKTHDPRLNVGVAVPPIAALRLNGQQEKITYQVTNRPTVLYIFAPPCTWCARNMDNFKTLLDKEKDQYRFIGLSLSEERLQEYVAKNDLELPIYSGLSAATKAAYKLSGTPQTIVVSPEGKVLQNWMGAYVGDQKTQVEAFFHVALPGMGAAPPEPSSAKGAGS